MGGNKENKIAEESREEEEERKVKRVPEKKKEVKRKMKKKERKRQTKEQKCVEREAVCIKMKSLDVEQNSSETTFPPAQTNKIENTVKQSYLRQNPRHFPAARPAAKRWQLTNHHFDLTDN